VRTSNFYTFLVLEIICRFNMTLACETLMLIQHFLQVLETDMSQLDQNLMKEMANEQHSFLDHIKFGRHSCQEK